ASLCFAQDFKKQVIYQIVTDRFFNGSAANDNPSQSAGLFDSTMTNWQAYWGGDLAGIQAKMAYLKGMGVTAIWISPTVDNENANLNSGTPIGAPYHGYDARDFMRVEEHFGDTSNSWTAFDNLTSVAHSNGIKVIVDWANNHSNYQGGGEFGALYNNGAFMASDSNDPNGYFHHNPAIGDFNDRYQLQYYTLESLEDLNQENSTIDSYLKTAVHQFQTHGADGFRLDAIKHVTWGWEYSFANSVFNQAPSFLYGEWYNNNPGDPMYHDAYKFANKTGINELDFGVNQGVRDVFGSNNNFSELDGNISAENSNFTWNNDLVTFFDSHDESRLLTLNNNNNRLHEAMAFLLTARGIPVILYGDEQYLHNDTSGGGDPYCRVWMSSFSTTTTAYQLISKLAGLRQSSNDALAYGTYQQRWINSDVYIYERQFFNDVVLVAINKNDTTSYAISSLNTALPAGTHSDYLGGLLGGASLTVTTGSGGNNPANNFTLPAHTVAVWQSTGTPTAPEAGSVGPTIGQPGMKVTIAGKGFGTTTGAVLFGTTSATINSWSDSSATFTVPGVTNGVYQVQLKNSGGTSANTIQFTVLAAKLIPVTFTVNNATPTSPGDYIFLTGSTVELGNWGTTFDTAIGPMLDPNYPNWFLNTSMPAGAAIQFKFIKIASNGTVTWENGANHQYTVPASGTGSVNVTWQN
ncbi:MAG TPA: alpha-amylase family glycosyl hydrolase, partial [Candidatus Sulfotelmatobacter sp.]|nr:alpha-amylase family glycosyl hydrolase [Candidatus Sulfotelmatobacter sp.]